jgi:dipeptidyl aminopeptidase/acylaminoacyl peptidase
MDGRKGFAVFAAVSAALVVSAVALAQSAPAPVAPTEKAAPAAAATTAPAATDARPPRIATADFARQPLVAAPRLSPDGTMVAARINAKGKEILAIQAITGSQPAKAISFPEKVELNWYRWAGNGTLLVSIGKTVPWFDDEAYRTQLVAYDLATSKFQVLGSREQGLTGDDVLWIDPEGKSLLLSYQRTIYDYPSVNLIDIATNKGKQVVPQRENIWDWYADDKGIVRFGFGYDLSRWQMVYRTTGEEKFKTIRVKEGDQDAGFAALKILQGSDEGYSLYLNDTTGRYALYKYNFATRTKGDLVFENATNDIEDFDLSFDGKELISAWYTDDRQRVHWFDPALKALQNDLDKAVGQKQAWVVSRSRDRQTLLVHVGSSSDPGSYYYYPLATGAMRRYGAVNDALSPRHLSASRYVSYKARDGLDIPAYLTLPRGRPAKNLPLILLPHGGPYDVRDDGSFDAEVQFYVNRGYAVLQPEFRGSGGYGKSFYEKGEGQYGRAMQDDLDDGMDWLTKQGTIDPKRVCIVGSSYGGYAALWGAVRNPERYRCAASFAGISDVRRQLKYQLAYRVSKRYRKDWRKTVQGEDQFDLKTVSPLHNVARLTVPVLMMHGDADQNVPFKQSKMYADALKSAGKTYEFYPLKDEGHGFSTSENMQLWLDKMDAFLAKYNPAD